MGESQAEGGVAAGHGRQRRQAEGARGTRRFYSHGGNGTKMHRFLVISLTLRFVCVNYPFTLYWPLEITQKIKDLVFWCNIRTGKDKVNVSNAFLYS